MKPSVLLVMPTGSGKTLTIIELFKKCIAARETVRILVLLDKVDLLNQTTYLLGNQFPMRVTEVCGTNGKNDLSGQIVVASVDTLISVPADELPEFNIVWIDEAHNADFEKGVYAEILKRITHPRLRIVGTTATPYRARGVIYGEGEVFDRIDFRISMQELIESKHLVRPICKRPDHQFDTDGLREMAGDYNEKDLDALVMDENKATLQIMDALPRLKAAGCKKTVWACINIDHAEFVKETIGESCAVIHSKQSWDVRNYNLSRFVRGDASHLAFVTVVAEGFDHPPVDGIVLLRPTRSANRYVQIVGRGLRPFGEKEYCFVLDYGRVVENLGPVDDPIIPERRKPGSKKLVALEKPMKFCPACLSYIKVQAKECPDCGYTFPVTQNLSKKAFEGDMMKGTGIKLLPTFDISFGEHLAKSGNRCIVVNYGKFQALREYFVWGNDWAMKRLAGRLAEIGVPLYDSFERTVAQTVERKPYEIEWKKDGKFDKVIQVRLSRSEGAGHPERDPPQAERTGDIRVGESI